MFYLNIDISALLSLSDNLDSAAKAALKKGAQTLSSAIYAHVVEDVQAKLHSSRDKYLQNLSMSQISEDTYVITLAGPAIWIEEGLPPNFDMVDFLLDDSPKPGATPGGPHGHTRTAKDGSKFRFIPFVHNKGPTAQTPAATSLTDTIKKEMKRQGAPYGKLEMGEDGKPKTGLVRSFDIMNKPPKTHNGPGQGKGPIGDVRQGNTGIPFLAGVRVYQTPTIDAAGKSKVKKTIVTFRTVSSHDKGTGKWTHPGTLARKFFESAHDWGMTELQERIGPMILEDLYSKL